MTPPQLDSDLKSRVPDNYYLRLPAPLNSSKPIFTLYGRNALNGVSRQIIKFAPQKKEVLVPSYSCGDEIESLVEAGFTPIIYPVTVHLGIDIHNLEHQINSDTGAVLVTHYFGFPHTNIAQILDLCKSKGVFLIEDCAQSLGGKLSGQPLGTFGHTSIFSLRKFLPIPHGGALLINAPEILPPQYITPPDKAVSFDLTLYRNTQRGLFPSATPISDIYSHLGVKLPSQHGPRLPQFGGYKLSLSNTAKIIISKIDFPKIAAARRKRFAFLLDLLKQCDPNIILKKTLAHDVVPLNFPVLVSNSDKIAQLCRKKGINQAQPFWSFLHKYVPWKNFSSTLTLKQGVLAISLNYDLTPNQCQALVDILARDQ